MHSGAMKPALIARLRLRSTIALLWRRDLIAVSAVGPFRIIDEPALVNFARDNGDDCQTASDLSLVPTYR